MAPWNMVPKQLVSKRLVGKEKKKPCGNPPSQYKGSGSGFYGLLCLFRLVWRSSPRHQSQWGIIVTEQ